MDKLTLRDVRCFRGDTSAHLAPLTFLVGENSTGKSTFLALTRVAWDIAYGLSEPDFNEEPFSLGAYDELAHYHGGQGKRAKSFAVGFSASSRPRRSSRSQKTPSTTVSGTFTAIGGQPILSSLTFAQAELSMKADLCADHINLHLKTHAGEHSLKTGLEFQSNWLSISKLFLLLNLLRFGVHDAERPVVEGSLPPPGELHRFTQALAGLSSPRAVTRRGSRELGRPYAIAPIRTKPRRTYDRLREDRSPEGDHTPMLLARLSETNVSEWQSLAAALSNYGRAAGLFEEVNVKRFGGKEASPFQVRMRMTGQHRDVNLVDVGYGVSQILPILVDCLVEGRAGFFLMQQPEVHLHPRAQAELGSFFAEMVRSNKHRFIVETHSDYIIDRVRMEVREGKIHSDAVAILFFERDHHGVRIHRLRLDNMGNITDQPSSYRRFFLEEEIRFIS